MPVTKRRRDAKFAALLRRDRRGATAVEAAILLPLALAVIYGLVELSYMMIARQETSRLVDILARKAITDSSYLQGVSGQQMVDSYNLMLDPAKLTINWSEESVPVSGDRFRISADYAFEFRLPIDTWLRPYNSDASWIAPTISYTRFAPKFQTNF